MLRRLAAKLIFEASAVVRIERFRRGNLPRFRRDSLGVHCHGATALVMHPLVVVCLILVNSGCIVGENLPILGP